MTYQLLTFSLLVASVAGQPQMCKEYLYEKACMDAGCRWRGATGTCTRQCHEFGGAVSPGTPESKIECTSGAIGCRVITHPTNPTVWKCGKLCNEFEVESNCLLAGYGTCRYANGDITGGAPMCTKMCNTIDDPDWCQKVHCIWNAAQGTCRRKCIEFQMKAPCESIGCTWVTPADGYPLSQCIPPGTPCPSTGCTLASMNSTFFAEGKTFKVPVNKNSTQGKAALLSAKKH